MRAQRYVPWLYWLTVVLVSIVGTQITDLLTDKLGVSLYVSTAVFSMVLLALFAIWYRVEHTLSIQSIDTRRRELFYWAAILCTFALGTAAGDLATEALGLGFQLGIVAFGALIALAAVAYWLGANKVLAFWMAYILTRPLGAALGDFLSQSQSYGGLGLGAMLTSAVFLVVSFQADEVALPETHERHRRHVHHVVVVPVGKGRAFLDKLLGPFGVRCPDHPRLQDRCDRVGTAHLILARAPPARRVQGDWDAHAPQLLLQRDARRLRLDQHVVRLNRQALACKVPRNTSTLVRPAAVRGIAQQRFKIALGRQLPQRTAQQLGLPRQRRVVEVQIHHPRCHGLLIDPQATRQQGFAHKGAAAHLAAHQPHRFKFGIHARGRHQRNAVVFRQPAVRRQARAGRQIPRTDLCGQCIDQWLIAGLRHCWEYRMY